MQRLAAPPLSMPSPSVMQRSLSLWPSCEGWKSTKWAKQKAKAEQGSLQAKYFSQIHAAVMLLREKKGENVVESKRGVL